MVQITIVVPTLGVRGGALRRALESALVHRSPEIDVLVVDNGTPDDSVAGLASSLAIECVRAGEVRGVAAAQQAGVESAATPFVSFLHSDDVLPLERPWPTLEGGVVGGSVSYDGRVEPAVRLDRPEGLLWHRTGVHISGYVFDRSLLLAEGFDASMPAWEDWDLLYRLSCRRSPYASSDDVFARVLDGAADRLSTRSIMATGLSAAFAKHRSAIAQDRTLLALWEYKIGRLHARAGDSRAARPWLLRSTVRDPLHPRRALEAVRLSLGYRGRLKPLTRGSG